MLRDAPANLTGAGAEEGRFDRPRLESVRLGGEHLREATNPNTGFVLVGQEVRLEREGEGLPTVTVEGKTRKVLMQLRPEDYERAIRAHQSRQLVACLGELKRQGRHLHLQEVRDFGFVKTPDVTPPAGD